VQRPGRIAPRLADVRARRQVVDDVRPRGGDGGADAGRVEQVADRAGEAYDLLIGAGGRKVAPGEAAGAGDDDARQRVATR
jgi:hypothetical protein